MEIITFDFVGQDMINIVVCDKRNCSQYEKGVYEPIQTSGTLENCIAGDPTMNPVTIRNCKSPEYPNIVRLGCSSMSSKGTCSRYRIGCN